MASDASQDIPQLMSRAQHTLDAARILLEKEFFPDAISRSYYAAFYAATALLHSEGITASKHTAVIAQFGQHFAKPGRLSTTLHRLLIDLFDERQSADYGGTIIAEDNAHSTFANAQQFVDEIERYLIQEGFLKSP